MANTTTADRRTTAARPPTTTARAAQQTIEKLADGATDKRAEQRIVDVLTAMSPQDRGECMRLIDGGGDRHTVARLLRHDIDDPRLRATATALVDEARPFSSQPGRIVISDIDDTLRPERGASADKRAFPGVRELYRALDAGTGGGDSGGDVHFVTARDGFISSGKPPVAEAGVDAGSIRHGDLASLVVSPFDHNHAIADKKVENIVDLLDRNPARTALLFGDTVQADPDVFRRVLEARPGSVDVCLLHEIDGHPAPAFARDDPRFVVFRDYADAARALHARGIISDAQEDAVVAAR